MKELLSPKQVARALGVSESSLKRWCDRGLIPFVRTGGGHRRLPISGVLAFLKQSKHELVEPEQLGLPATSGTSDRMLDRSCESLRTGLLTGDEAVCRQVIFDLWLSGRRLSEICDRVVARAFREIGEQWACNEAEVYQERRACEIGVRVLLELRTGIAGGEPKLFALGGTPEGDPYVLPTTAVELVLQESGWQSRSLGSSIPLASLASAIRQHRPRLFWLSVSYVADTERFVREFKLLNEAADESGTAIAIGGYALDANIRQQLRYSAFCDTLQHLEEFIRSLARLE